MQGSIYIFARRALLPIAQLLFDAEKLLISGKLSDAFNSAVFRVSAIVTETLNHLMMMVSMSRILPRFFSILDKFSEELQWNERHLDLSSIRSYSLAGLIYILIMVLYLYLKWWDLYGDLCSFYLDHF